MPCHEYHPKRFMVEMDEREYDRMMELCRDLHGGFISDLAPTISRRRGRCIDVIMAVAERALELIDEAGMTIDDFFEKAKLILEDELREGGEQ